MSELEARLAGERDAFDRVFAAPPAVAVAETVRILCVRAGGDRFALRVGELAGLHHGKRVIPLGGDAAALVGMVGLRGRVVPVFSLARLLGYAADEPPRWLALCGGDEPLALGFASFEGHLEIAPAALCAADARSGSGRAHVREVVRLADGVVPVVGIGSIVTALGARKV